MAVEGTYEINGNHIYVFFTYPPDYTTKQILIMYGAYPQRVPRRYAWVLRNTKENQQFVESLLPTPKPDPLRNRPHCAIGLADVLVRGNSFRCKNHLKTDYAGEVPLLLRDGNIQYALIPVSYCHDCDYFFVLDKTFQDLRKKGVIACRVTDYQTFKDYHPHYNIPASKWNQISPLRLFGYCVNQQENLTDEQRQSILEKIVDNGILPKDRVLSYLSFFMRNPIYGQNAIEKWDADYKYLESYQLGSARRVVVNGFIRLG